MLIGFLLSASHGNSELRNAWATKRTICQSTTPPTIPRYMEYFDYLMFHSKQLEASVSDNTSTQQANLSETDYLSQNSPSDPDYQHANDLSDYMGIQDADFTQYTLECNKAINERKPCPPQRTRRAPVQEDLKIKEAWGEMTKEHQQEWIKAKATTKEKILAQRQPQSSGKVTKNHQLRTDGRTVYKLEFEDDNGDGYYSDYTANSEATYDFNVHSSVYNTTSNDDSNGESVLEGKEMNVSAAAAMKARSSSILKQKRRKKIFKASEMLADAVPKIMASKQMPVMTPDGKKVAAYLTMAENMTNMNYSRCDSLIPIPIEQPPLVDLHYKVHLLHQHELDYRASMSKLDRVIGGRHLALVDGGANGTTIGRDMRIIYFNADGKRVRIGIAGDHHLTGNKVCFGCSIAKSNLGWIKLLWAQGAQVKTQDNPAGSDPKKKLDVIQPETVVETVVDDSKHESTSDPVVVELNTGPIDGTNVQYRSKPKPKKKKKKTQHHWNNNKKKTIRWKDQPRITSFPDHLLEKKEVPTDIKREMKAMFERAQIHGMAQIDGMVYYDSNDEDPDDDVNDDSTFHDTIQVESTIYDTDDDDNEPIHGKTINNNFNPSTGFEEGATGLTIELDNILHAQYCHSSGDLYYQPIEIYGDDPDATDEAIKMMANATQSWSLCDGSPPFPTHPILSLGSDK